MPEDLDGALLQLRPLLLDPDRLVRAVAAGRRRSATPPWRRVELRPIDLKDGRHLQVVTYDDRRATTANPAYGVQAEVEVDALLAEPFGNWHVQTTTETLQLRVTKKGQAQLHRTAESGEQVTGHDRAARHLIDPGDPLFRVLGAGAAKRRQVDAFLRVLQAAVAEARPPGRAAAAGRRPRLRQRLPDLRGLPLPQRGPGGATHRHRPAAAEMRERNTALAAELGWGEHLTFEAGDIIDTRPATTATPEGALDVVLALHACDTATDDALAQAVHWEARVVLASPCCHHDLQRQMSAGRAPAPYGLVARHAILRERLGDAAHRRGPRGAAPSGRLPRRGRAVRVRGVHPAQHDDPRGPHHRPAARPRGRRGVRRARRRLGRHPTPADAARRRPCRPRLARSRRWPGCCSPPAPAPHVVLTLQDPSITESSGLAVSARHPGVLWTHNDGGSSAQVVAVDRRGESVARVTLAGVDPYDPEALAPGVDGKGRPVLFLGDLGDNERTRSNVSVFRFREPARLADSTVDATVVPLHLPRRAARRRSAARRAPTAAS